MDGPLLVDNEGLHGMSEKCGSKELSSGSHIVYIEGFQAGGGVGMIARYSGPDTGDKKVLMRSGAAGTTRRYYAQCDPATQSDPSLFTMCMFRSEIGLDRIPKLRDADKGVRKLYFAGKGHLPVVDMHSLLAFKDYVASTPAANYAWAIYGQLKIAAEGVYSLCISSDDGYTASILRLAPVVFSPHAMVANAACQTDQDSTWTVRFLWMMRACTEWLRNADRSS